MSKVSFMRSIRPSAPVCFQNEGGNTAKTIFLKYRKEEELSSKQGGVFWSVFCRVFPHAVQREGVGEGEGEPMLSEPMRVQILPCGTYQSLR